MTQLHVSTVIHRPLTTVQKLLLHRPLLQAFIDKQHPSTKTISVDESTGQVDLAWTTILAGELPGLVVKLVGHQIDVSGGFTVGGAQRLTLDIHAKRDGELRGTLSLSERDPSSTLVDVQGDITVRIGLGGGQLAGYARDRVLIPIFDEDLFPLLRDWPEPGDDVGDGTTAPATTEGKR